VFALSLWPDGVIASGVLLAAAVFALLWRGLRIHLTIRDEGDEEP
jgi:hypothetical protein